METILIQETDAATLEVVTVALQMEGYQICSLTDHHENALEMIRRHHPKLVLLDKPLFRQADRSLDQSAFSRIAGDRL
ncbi:hypothetical protein AB6735_14420 [Mucilaginibacter sp. RCC_168]|uniref:hypothetical protein n=1 Tax=Mucilaginibacter sp. RCC_168 TaxID=3239221 RepID=UPI003524FA03